MEEIIIRIKKGGTLNLNVGGVKGTACKDLTKGLEKALGAITETKETEEYYQQQENTNNQNVGGNSENNW